MIKEKLAYVYKHIRPDTNQVFYVGIGTRQDRASSKYGRNQYWKNIVAKCNGEFAYKIVKSKLSWNEACEKEKELIKIYGRYPNGSLCNLTDGGEGILNLKHTEEVKSKISKAAKERYKLKPHVRKGKRFTNRNSRKVVIVNIKTYIIYRFDTLVQAGLFINKRGSCVRRACITGKVISNYYAKFGTDITDTEMISIKNNDFTNLSIRNYKRDYSSIQKKVIDTQTNMVYKSILEAAKVSKIPFSTLSRKLNGISKNNTNLKFL